MLKKILFLLAVIVLIPKAAFAYANPGQPVGYVNDFAGLLSQSTRTQLEQNLIEFEKQTKHEVVVVTITKLDNDTIENFAVKLFEDWKIGKKGADNGILFLIAKDDRQMRIEVGYGLEGALPDATAYKITEKIVKPLFRNGDYDGGVVSGIEAIEKSIKGEDVSALVNTNSSSENSTSSNLITFGFVAALMFLRTGVRYLSRSKAWWPGGLWGAGIGAVIGFFMFGFIAEMVVVIVFCSLFGLVLDFLTSKTWSSRPHDDRDDTWFGGGGFGGGGGGGFGGFGGGGSGGGGSSSSW